MISKYWQVIKIRHMSKKIDILCQFLSDYTRLLTGREIARMIKVNHQTALNHLNEMNKEKILKYCVKGRNKEYSLNLSNIKTLIILEMAESFRALDSLSNKELRFIIPDLLPYTESIILFGSFASDSHDNNSDIDLILVGISNKVDIEKIKRRYNREINIEYITFKGLKNSLKHKRALAIEILKNHIVYGNTSAVVKILIDWYRR